MIYCDANDATTPMPLPLKILVTQLKAISRKKAAPWIFAHYKKIYNFCPILMKLGENDQPMR